MQTDATQPTAPASSALKLARAPMTIDSVDCGSGFDFSLWIDIGEALYLAPITVARGFGAVRVDSLKCWENQEPLTLAEVATFANVNADEILRLCEEAYRKRCQKFI
jgi:hypothetical protein